MEWKQSGGRVQAHLISIHVYRFLLVSAKIFSTIHACRKFQVKHPNETRFNHFYHCDPDL